MKSAGVNIFAPIDGSRLGFGLPQQDRLKTLAEYYDVARRHSDKNFLIMPNEEGGAAGLGGHNDILLSKPVFWLPTRAAGQPFMTDHPTYGKVYNVGGPEDMMEMARQENMLIFMPHPRSKGSTGYPDAIKDRNYFIDEHYRGIGVRWGMGLDGSELRLCEIRCQTLWDEMNNWIADQPARPKYIQAIAETYQQGPGDDVYANTPVNYVKLDTLPGSSDWSSDHRRHEARRLLLDIGRSADSDLRGQGHGREADDCRRCRVDLPARFHRGGVGRWREDRPPDHLGDRPRAVRA